MASSEGILVLKKGSPDESVFSSGLAMDLVKEYPSSWLNFTHKIPFGIWEGARDTSSGA